MTDRLEADVVVAHSGKHHGIALWPPASDDPHDPFRWPRWFKVVALLSVATFNFTANFARAGFSVASPVLGAEFRKNAKQVNALPTVSHLQHTIRLKCVPVGVRALCCLHVIECFRAFSFGQSQLSKSKFRILMPICIRTFRLQSLLCSCTSEKALLWQQRVTSWYKINLR